ncbi:MAG TPA: tetratricopeptide repeat protein [Blastocatellia bacterium]|nr:tetratricopeptide repeat protein [Blastocatellia bacterium]
MIPNSTIARICLVLIIAASASASVSAQRRGDPLSRSSQPSLIGSGSIVGRVYLPSGKPAGIRFKVSVSSMQNTGTMIHTDYNGEFSFTNLPESTYVLEVVGDSKLYEPASEQVIVVRGGKSSVTIYMRERSEAGPGKPAGGVVSAAELAQPVPAAAKKEFDRASNLLREGRRDEAIEHLKQALAIYPEYLMALNDLGVQYLKLKRFDAAAEQLGAAIEINAKVFNPRLNLGIVLVEQNKYSEAVEQLNEAIAINSSLPAPRLYLGIALLRMDDLDAAEEELSKAISLGDESYALGHYYMAQVQMKKGNREKAIAELKTYIEKNPEGEEITSARAMLNKVAGEK